MGYHSLLKGIFLTQGSNPHLFCLLHRRVLYHWCHLGSPALPRDPVEFQILILLVWGGACKSVFLFSLLYFFDYARSYLRHAGSSVFFAGSLWQANSWLKHVGSSSLIRDGTWAPGLGVWPLSHWTTREALQLGISKQLSGTLACHSPQATSN